MVRFGSAYALWRVAILLALTQPVLGCGGDKPEVKRPIGGQGAEMTAESGFGGEAEEADEEVEPADHDIEVPPAP
jgi:hypothetical protein